MEAIASFSIVVILIIGIIWLVPFVIILLSNKTTGLEKLGWLLAVFFVTWFAWIFYYLFAPVIKKG
jgi:hypothetical protein